jgi:chorismate mutase/ribosomal protein S18 acetylase RimI-like enzyme
MSTEVDLVVRPAAPEDSRALADLYSAARVAAVPTMPPARHTNDEDRAWFATRLAADNQEAWVALRGDAVVGYALITRTERWLDHLFVRPDLKGGGVGSALLDIVKATQPDGFCLWVFESNEPARAFYAQRGLVELERTDGSGNEERSPDIKMAWPGHEPLAFYRGLIDDVDAALAGLLARRAGLTRAVQGHKRESGRDPERERQIAESMAAVAPELGLERLSRIMHLVIGELLDAAQQPPI